MAVDPLSRLRRLSLGALPTPLERAPRLAAHAGLAELLVKREDLSGYTLGGNKLRQIDFIMADALAQEADVVIATAGSQSNFCRALAGAAAKLGLVCHLHLRSATGTEPVGNLLLDAILGARITFTEHTDPWHPAIRAEMDALADKYRSEGSRPYVAQLTGASAHLGIAGWTSGAAELVRDFTRLGSVPDTLFVVCGSGLTMGGLALGFKHLRCPIRVIGVSAQQPEMRLKPWVLETANAAAARLAVAARLEWGDITILDDQIGPGYGIPSAASLAAVHLAGRMEGLVLDPIYTGKGMAGMLHQVRSGSLASRSVVFLHSGGAPGLFAHAAALLGSEA